MASIPLIMCDLPYVSLPNLIKTKTTKHLQDHLPPFHAVPQLSKGTPPRNGRKNQAFQDLYIINYPDRIHMDSSPSSNPSLPEKPPCSPGVMGRSCGASVNSSKTSLQHEEFTNAPKVEFKLTTSGSRGK